MPPALLVLALFPFSLATGQQLARRAAVQELLIPVATAESLRVTIAGAGETVVLVPGLFVTYHLAREAGAAAEQVQGESAEGGLREKAAGVPGLGEYFSRGLHNPMTGTNEWASVETPFFLKPGERPDLIRLNVVIEGGGTATIVQTGE